MSRAGAVRSKSDMKIINVKGSNGVTMPYVSPKYDDKKNFFNNLQLETERSIDINQNPASMPITSPLRRDISVSRMKMSDHSGLTSFTAAAREGIRKTPDEEFFTMSLLTYKMKH